MSKLFSDKILAHDGTKGMKWGYHNGIPNGKKKAGINNIQTQTQSQVEWKPNDKFPEVKTYEDYIRIKEKAKKEHEEASNNYYAKRRKELGEQFINNFFNIPK